MGEKVKRKPEIVVLSDIHLGTFGCIFPTIFYHHHHLLNRTIVCVRNYA